MSFISEKDEVDVNPLSDEIAEKLQSSGIFIDRFKLKEFAFNRSKLKFQKINPTLSEKAINKLADFEVNLEYAHDLKSLIDEYVIIFGLVPLTVPSNKDHEKRVAELAKNNEKLFPIIFAEELPETQKNSELDQVVAVGGLTRLHLAAQNGDYQEVDRLVRAGAKVNIRDNAKMTPKQRAEAMGHIQISNFLAQF